MAKFNRLSYKAFFWISFIITTVIFVADRYTTNVWPRNDFNQPGVGDKMTIRDGPWTVKFDQIFSMFSGRYTIWALNFMFFTMMHTCHDYLATTFIGRNIIDFGDQNDRTEAHRLVGISLCFVTLLHVSSILAPVMFSGYDLQVRPGYFVWPLSEAAPKGFQASNSTTEIMMMQVDDVYRFILMYFLLIPVVYVSIQWMAGNYRFGIRLHQFVMLMYFIDIVRRHSHPHCWVYNVPVFIAWVLDRVWGHYYLHQRTDVKKIMISDNYMFIYFKSSVKIDSQTIANFYHLRCTCSACNLERSHPFTHMQKRNAIMSSWPLIMKSGLENSKNDVPKQEDWDHGILIRTYKGNLSHTREMREMTELNMDLWGSFECGNIGHYIEGDDDVILVGGGSGSIFLLDTLTYLASFSKYIDNQWKLLSGADTEEAVWHLRHPDFYKPSNAPRVSMLLFQTYNNEKRRISINSVDSFQRKLKKSIGIILTSNDPELVMFLITVIDDIMTRNSMPTCINLNITIAMTKKLDSDKSFHVPFVTWGKIKLGRADFVEEIKSMTSDDRLCNLFCQGGPGLQDAVRNAAKQTNNNKYHEAHSFDSGVASFKVSCTCPGSCV